MLAGLIDIDLKHGESFAAGIELRDIDVGVEGGAVRALRLPFGNQRSVGVCRGCGVGVNLRRFDRADAVGNEAEHTVRSVDPVPENAGRALDPGPERDGVGGGRGAFGNLP